MSIASDGIDNWRGNLSADIFPIDPLKLNSSDDIVRQSRTLLEYPLAIDRTGLERPTHYEREEKYDIVWDDTGESILPIVEFIEN